MGDVLIAGKPTGT